MFDVTEAEKKAWNDYQDLHDHLETLKKASSEGTVADLSGMQALESQIDDFEKNEDFAAYCFKTRLIDRLDRGFPFPFGMSVLPRMAEELLSVVESEEGARIARAFHKTLLYLLEHVVDEELNRASARILALQYHSLIEAGLPEDLAGRIVLARSTSTAFNGVMFQAIQTGVQMGTSFLRRDDEE